MKKLLLAVALLCIAGPSWAATCKISEYRVLASDSNGNEIQVALEPPITTQTVSYTTSNQSSALNDETRFIRIVCDAKAHFKITAAGTNAAATDPFIAADSPEYFGVQPNRDLIVDFYDGSS